MEAGQLPDHLQIVGGARSDLNDSGFRQLASEHLQEHAGDVAVEVREAFLERLRYQAIDLADVDDVATIVNGGDSPVTIYFALPPSVFATALRTLDEVGLPPSSRIVIEKPFGEDLESARALNELTSRITGAAGEHAIFRVDHVLGMPTVHNLLGARLANRVLEPLWNSTHVEQVDILWDETLALEGRAGYYDSSGALRDVIQNHLLQILCLVAMEPPTDLSTDELRARKTEVLRSVRILTPEEAAGQSVRARYTSGTLAPPPDGTGAQVPAYVDEPGVDAARGTETFAELILELEHPRWSGTRFVLRAGKALSRRRKGVILRFRPVPSLPFDLDAGPPPQNELRIGLDGPESFTLDLTGCSPGPPAQLTALEMEASLPANELPAYSYVLHQVIEGDDSLSISAEEAELSWQIVTPYLTAWERQMVPLQDYAAGSSGPADRFETREQDPPTAP